MRAGGGCASSTPPSLSGFIVPNGLLCASDEIDCESEEWEWEEELSPSEPAEEEIEVGPSSVLCLTLHIGNGIPLPPSVVEAPP